MEEKHVHYKFAILAATAFYGPTVERSIGRPLQVRAKKADALWRALPQPERSYAEKTLKALCAPEPDTIKALSSLQDISNFKHGEKQ